MAPARELPPPAASDSALADIERDFEAFGLSGNEASVLLAVMRLGSATAMQLTRMCPVTNANIYKFTAALETKRLVERVPGAEPATWMTVGRDETLERLCQAHRERLRQLEARAERVKKALADSVPEASSLGVPFMHLIPGPVETSKAYEQLLSQARSELLMFTTPPFAGGGGRERPVVLAALARGVSMRVLYPRSIVSDPHGEEYRTRAESYHAAGVDDRVVDTLPMKLSILDRRFTLVGLIDPSVPGTFPKMLLVDHPGFAEHQAAGFESRWTEAVPYQDALAQARAAEMSTAG